MLLAGARCSRIPLRRAGSSDGTDARHDRLTSIDAKRSRIDESIRQHRVRAVMTRRGRVVDMARDRGRRDPRGLSPRRSRRCQQGRRLAGHGSRPCAHEILVVLEALENRKPILSEEGEQFDGADARGLGGLLDRRSARRHARVRQSQRRIHRQRGAHREGPSDARRGGRAGARPGLSRSGGRRHRRGESIWPTGTSKQIRAPLPGGADDHGVAEPSLRGS